MKHMFGVVVVVDNTNVEVMNRKKRNDDSVHTKLYHILQFSNIKYKNKKKMNKQNKKLMPKNRKILTFKNLNKIDMLFKRFPSIDLISNLSEYEYIFKMFNNYIKFVILFIYILTFVFFGL